MVETEEERTLLDVTEPVPEDVSLQVNEASAEVQPEEAASLPGDTNHTENQGQLDLEFALAVHEAEVKALCQEQQGVLDYHSLVSDVSATVGKLIPRLNALPLGSARDVGRQRLDLRLDMYGLEERVVPGDGNCQFASLSDQLYSTPKLHAVVREKVVWELSEFPERYRDYVSGETYDHYCRQMARTGTWGDHITLQAAADFFRLRICLLTSFEDTCVVEVEPQGGAPGSRTLWLTFWAEVHYNSIHPEGEPAPSPKLLQSKLLGSKRLHNLIFG